MLRPEAGLYPMGPAALDSAMQRTYAPGATLIQEREPSTLLYLSVSGTAVAATAAEGQRVVCCGPVERRMPTHLPAKTVARVLRLTAPAAEVREWHVMTDAYPVRTPSTGGLDRVSGTTADGDHVFVFVKTLPPLRHWQLIAAIPADDAPLPLAATTCCGRGGTPGAALVNNRRMAA